MTINDKRMKVRPGVIFCTILVTAFAGGGLSALAASATSSTAVPLVTSPTAAEDGLDTMADLKRTRQDSDRLPPSIDPLSLGMDGILSDSTRLMGQTDGAFFWTGLDRDGSICLIVGFKSEKDFVTSSCSLPEMFAVQGISVQTGSTKYVAEAYLVPDDAVGSLPPLDMIEGSLSSNLILANPQSVRRAEVATGADASSRAGESFPLVVFAEPLDLGW